MPGLFGTVIFFISIKLNSISSESKGGDMDGVFLVSDEIDP
tara:strand:- start:307 stop:429 length:123 start_codon:yes stop_codon:yes gene_type:complete